MKNNIISLKKLVGALGLLIIVGSPTSLVISNIDSKDSKQTRQPTESEIELVVRTINAMKYELAMDVNSKLNDLKKEINVSLIKEKLPSEVVKVFRDDLFTINKITHHNGIELSPYDLAKIGVINAKINYNYGKKENQSTNLRIDVVTVRGNLNAIFNKFEFKDKEGVTGFLDANDLVVISRQILVKLNGSNLEQMGLTLENRTSNSITLKAKRNSKQYKGQVNLVWNLKLFEVYGYEHQRWGNIWIEKGLKGYFYLDRNDNRIKFFSYQKHAGINDPIHSHFYDYHKFVFSSNKVKKDFVFNGEENASENGVRFGSFAFNKGVNVVFFSPEPDRVKVFNKNNNQWEGFTKSTEFIINSLGEMTQKK